MTTKEITTATANLSFDQANYFIEYLSGLDVEKIKGISTSILWKVNNNKEICFISNSMKDLFTGMSDVKYTYNS